MLNIIPCASNRSFSYILINYARTCKSCYTVYSLEAQSQFYQIVFLKSKLIALSAPSLSHSKAPNRASVFPLKRVGFAHIKQGLQLERKWAALFTRKTKGLQNSDWKASHLFWSRKEFPTTNTPASKTRLCTAC